MEQIEVREGARRQHRSLAMFCALYCWQHDKKGVFVRKEMLLAYLGLERLKDVRANWIIEDVGQYFTHIFRKKIKNNEYFIFSRISSDELSTNKEALINLEPKIFNINEYSAFDYGFGENHEEYKKVIDYCFPFLSSIKNLNEFVILNGLSLFANGICNPHDVLAIDAKKSN